MSRLAMLLLAAVALALPAVALAHELGLDHPVPTTSTGTRPSPDFRAGGENAKWESMGSIFTGNPHTDLDFFTVGGDTYASVGTIGTGPNGGGQTIVRLTNGDRVMPQLITGHPSASCVSRPDAALGLQHDVEATPKGDTLLNTANAFADRRETQLLIDATDDRGRCHDQGIAGIENAPLGGLEIVDITGGVNRPEEIHLTSHIGEAHTVNIDPKRPHIAYAVPSDSVGVSADGVRANESDPSDYSLDGWEVVDLSSCMNFPAEATIEEKRDACRPQVYRYRYPSAAFGQGHTADDASGASRGVYGCHELEVYPDDRLTCAGGPSTFLFDMSGAFDDNGTPADYTDDKPRGTPLPCAVRDSSTAVPQLKTGAKVTDCVTGLRDGEAVDLRVKPWLDAGAPSLAGVEFLGRAIHMGRGAGGRAKPTFDSTQDIDFSHEAELTHSGRYLFASDERGGGVVPPGAACDQADQNKAGNGGLHFYAVDKLRQAFTGDPETAWQSYARTPKGGKAIYRAPIRTGAQATICTAHVFQQIPGQNRIFMGWYSQGTQVIDFTEHKDGTISFKEAGFYIPASANEWVSHVYKVERERDGRFTYYGAAGDFNVGQGRNSIDLWKVTLPPPPEPRIDAEEAPPAAEGPPPEFPLAPTTGSSAKRCKGTPGLSDVSAKPKGRGLRLAFEGARGRKVDVAVFRVSKGRQVITDRVARFRGVRKAFTWSGRGARNGHYLVRFWLRERGIDNASLRVAVQRSKGRFKRLGAVETRPSCDVIERAKLFRPVFGGRQNTPLVVTLRARRQSKVSATLVRRGQDVRRSKERTVGKNQKIRLRIPAKGLKRGDYGVRITFKRRNVLETVTLRGRRI